MDKPTPGEVIRTYRESRGITLTSMSRVLYCSKSEPVSYTHLTLPTICSV